MKPRQVIYYLDDDADDLYFFRIACQKLGHKVSLFADGHELLLALRRNEEEPDVIFLDIHMPILNGEEILNIIKKSPDWKHIPVVMISGAYPKKLVRQFAEAGANHLMKKPTGNEDLKTALEN